MTALHILPLDSGALSSVAKIESECFSAPWSESSLKLLLTGENGGLVAMDGERIVGYIGYLGVIDEYEITNVAVSPDCRRQGIGAALLSTLLTQAKSRGVLRVTLDVRVSNTPAIALYEKFGFAPCGMRKNFYTNPREDASVMELLI